MNVENLKNDLGPDIERQLELIKSLTLLGDRVIVLLDRVKGHTVTESGIIIPDTKIVETEGGRLGTELSDREHLTCGTVIQVSEFSNEKLNNKLEVGDRVYVHASATAKAYHFFPDRTKLVQEFAGFISIPHVHIEAIINK